MLSICIPIYNFDVGELVRTLQQEAESLGVEYEILLSDDASLLHFRAQNDALKELNNVRYLQSEQNLGRTGNRNLLFREAKYRYILFMDCDSQVACPGKYIKHFLPYCQPGIVCSGGRLYGHECSDHCYRLHRKAGAAREALPAAVRSRNPNNSFMTCNFLIDKTIFDIVKFDERLQGYGHEDTLFGVELKKKGIAIQHIDNPLYHIGLETAEEFLSKTEAALHNMHKIMQLTDADPAFIDSAKILRMQRRLKQLYLVKGYNAFFERTKNLMRKNLMGRRPYLFVFDLYKLGVLCRLASHTNP